MTETNTPLADHYHDPRNRGRLDHPDATGSAGGGSGSPSIVFDFRLRQRVVVKAMFEAHGCGYTIACGSIVTELLEGKSIDECLRLAESDIVSAIGEFPPHKRHCPRLAIAAIRDALDAR